MIQPSAIPLPRDVILWMISLASATSVGAVTTKADDKTDFFEKRIRPVLVEHCYECHAEQAEVIQAGLRLDRRDTMMRGGDSGAAIVPGDPNGSLLVKALRYEESEMPPDGKLDDRIIRDFENWIRDGAPSPDPPPLPTGNPSQPITTDESEIDWQSAREFWAFQKPTRHPAPEVSFPQWVKDPIDAFVLARLERKGLAPTKQASRNTILRRVAFDLTGLPPSKFDADQFLRDDQPGAYERLVDRLVSSPANAQRWARVWLDVARFAEDQAHIVGNNDSLTYPNAYLYRDWVVDALATDMPYDEFVQRQLAADQMFPDDLDAHLGLGFLGLGPKYYRRNSPEVMADEWEDRVDTVSRGLLGLTVACARCHDHKYDPIPTEDYYAMAGVFAGTQMFNRPLRDDVENKNGEAKKPQDAVHIVREGKPTDLNVMIRGDATKKGEIVPRGFLKILSGSEQAAKFKTGSGRIDLAKAITDEKNPLAARVIVNRVWRQLMGRGLVETPSNFGTLGNRPTHPKLLDDLAVRFMQNGWSLKWLQRQIVLSSTYRQSSQSSDESIAADPANQFYGRMSRRRLSVEAYRDALLVAAGRLDNSMGGPSMAPEDPAETRRTLYSHVSRLELNALLARFDFPDPNAHSAGRVETITPLQKLFLLNSPFLVTQSRSLAEQILKDKLPAKDSIASAYARLYQRQPTVDEISDGQSFLASVANELSESDAWSQYIQALMIANEMFLLD